jgi:hypothetical protein
MDSELTEIQLLLSTPLNAVESSRRGRDEVLKVCAAAWKDTRIPSGEGWPDPVKGH